MLPVVGEVAAAAADLGIPPPVLTSGNDGIEHGERSLHYRNRAVDFRGNTISDAKGLAMRNLLRRRLGDQYDILFEVFKEPARDHLHVEFDPPKNGR